MNLKINLFYMIFLLNFSMFIYGENHTISIPSQSWLISFDAPTILQFEGSSNKAEFQYKGMSDNGFNITIFVENKKGEDGGHKACADFYWPQAKRNPHIDQSTVQRTDLKNFIKIAYWVKGEHQGTKFEIPNINYYFEFNNKWIDVHISKFPFEKSDETTLRKFTETLKYMNS